MPEALSESGVMPRAEDAGFGCARGAVRVAGETVEPAGGQPEKKKTAQKTKGETGHGVSGWAVGKEAVAGSGPGGAFGHPIGRKS